MYAKNSNTANTIRRAVIRDEIGHYKLRQCHPVTRYTKPVSRWKIAESDKTIGDILNKLKINNNLRSVIRGM